MINARRITEEQLDDWVRRNSRTAQGEIVELVFRLVAASVRAPQERRFPLGDSIGQHGPDGKLKTDIGYPPFVPEGLSYWEIGTSLNAQRKATSDYKKLTSHVPESVRRDAAFVFVTPLSGRRDWEHTWKPEGQEAWLEERRKLNEWKSVHVLDGTMVIDWLLQLLAVELWFAERIGMSPRDVSTPELYWDLIKEIGAPPILHPKVFLENRDDVRHRIGELFERQIPQLRIETYHPHQIANLVSAHIASMDPNKRIEASGRCLIVSTPDAWGQLTSLSTPHVLVADFPLVEQDHSGFLQAAKKGGHGVIYESLPGGISPDCVRLWNPSAFQLQKALEEGRYTEERARALAQRSGGNLNSLLRILQDLSLTPDWAH